MGKVATTVGVLAGLGGAFALAVHLRPGWFGLGGKGAAPASPPGAAGTTPAANKGPSGAPGAPSATGAGGAGGAGGKARKGAGGAPAAPGAPAGASPAAECSLKDALDAAEKVGGSVLSAIGPPDGSALDSGSGTTCSTDTTISEGGES